MMGQQLNLSLKYINIAVVYMHRFYTCYSFKKCHRLVMASVCLYVAAKREKAEEQTVSLAQSSIEDILKAQFAMNAKPFPGVGTSLFKDHANDLLAKETLLHSLLRNHYHVNLPHCIIIKYLAVVTEAEPHTDISKAALFLASNCLHLTPMCLLYEARTIATFCIYLACKWSGWECPPSIVCTEKAIDLQNMQKQYLDIYEASPARLKEQLEDWDYHERRQNTLSSFFVGIPAVFAPPKRCS